MSRKSLMERITYHDDGTIDEIFRFDVEVHIETLSEQSIHLQVDGIYYVITGKDMEIKERD